MRERGVNVYINNSFLGQPSMYSTSSGYSASVAVAERSYQPGLEASGLEGAVQYKHPSDGSMQPCTYPSINLITVSGPWCHWQKEPTVPSQCRGTTSSVTPRYVSVEHDVE